MGHKFKMRHAASCALLLGISTSLLPAAMAATGADCCSADAMKREAAPLSGIDIAGIKLGMTPEQAFAAVQAFNPKMIVQVNKGSFYEMPPDTPNRKLPIPWYAIAHTPGSSPTTFMATDTSTDQILIEFATPPSPPVVVRVIRYANFPAGQPLLASTLDDSLTMKYGPVSSHGPNLAWFYGPDGKPTNGSAFCSSAGNALFETPAVPPYSPGNLTTNSSPMLQEFAAIEADKSATVGYLKSCRNFGAIVTVVPGDDIGRDAKIVQMTVVLSSPELLYASRKNAQDFVQAKFDAYRNKQNDAAKSRAAPKL